MGKRVPTYEVGDMWSVWEVSDLFLITANASFTAAGTLVMGRGIARQALERFPGLAKALAEALRTPGRRYGLLVSPCWPQARLGLFQTKLRYWEPAAPELIRLATKMLLEWLEVHPGGRVDLNFPGIGNGRLPMSTVCPIIEVLPPNVHVWLRAREEVRHG